VFVRRILLSFLGAVTLIGSLLFSNMTFAMPRLVSPLSPLAAGAPLCFTATSSGIILSALGYVKQPGGNVSLTLEVKNGNKEAINAVSLVATGWTPVEPATGSTVNGKLGPMRVSWVDNKGAKSINFEPAANSFAQNKSELFAVTVKGFAVNTPVQVQIKNSQGTSELKADLKKPGCDRTAEQPISPLQAAPTKKP
jgi:hypothetical protein